jgi:hypothetical protein
LPRGEAPFVSIIIFILIIFSFTFLGRRAMALALR